MKKLETIKNVSQIIVGIGVSTIVNNVVKNNTSEEKGAVKKLCIWAGGLVLASMVCSKANDYLSDKIDEVAKASKPVVEEEKKEPETT